MSPYLVSARYDWAFFLAPPVLALVLGVALAGTSATAELAALGDSPAGLGLAILIHAHLVAVVFRSHTNPTIFERHRVRFVVVPLVLFVALVASDWIALAATVVATFWDVWHSGAQTFGFARIYDRNAGVPPERDRKLDFAMSQLLYVGPVLAGATLFDHLAELELFADYADPVSQALAHVPAETLARRPILAVAIALAIAIVVTVYLGVAWRRHRRGEPVSALKLWLVLSTGVCSIVAWGFNTWGEAFFVMNLFHAVQYLALVWWSEGRRLARGRLRRAGALAIFFGGTLTYGVFAATIDAEHHALWSLTIVVSLMHFWYDAFVWSVRRGDV